MTVAPREPVGPSDREVHVFADGHVHGHGCFDPGDFFRHAAVNFGRAIRDSGLEGPAVRCLLLTESPGERFFERLGAGGERRPGAPGWRIRPTGEDGSLLVALPEGGELCLVAGRQIATRERLELLALGTTTRFAGLPNLVECIAAVREAGAVPVIPWGFGKWWFRRGRLVRRALEQAASPGLFVGDNGGRPRWAGPPRIFGLAEALGVPVLPGSDPLPFPGQVRRVAGYGFILRGRFDPGRPAESMRRLLAGLTRSPSVFGRREGLLGFLRAQVGMQWRTRRRSGPG